jgi:hypothetical protein
MKMMGTIDRACRERRLQQCAKLMSPAQIQVIRSFLIFAQENSDDAEWLESFVGRALETVWR